MFDARVVDAVGSLESMRVAQELLVASRVTFAFFGDLQFHPQALNPLSQSNEQYHRTVLLSSFHLNGHT